MKATSYFLLCLVLPLLSALAADSVSTFSTLPQGDELHIRYTTSGCFHQRTTEFRFVSSPEPKMAVIRTNSRRRDDPPEFQRISTGTISFRPDQVLGLDRLLQVYRSRESFGSTTQHELTITQLRGEQVIATETYKHVGPRRDAKGIPTFDKLSRDIGTEPQ